MSIKKNLFSVVVVGIATIAFGEVTTGWIQSAAGTYDYSDTANWANGEVNGIFSEDLALEGDVVVRFTDDTTIAGLKVACVGNGKKLSFICDNKRTITCTGDLLVESVDLGSVEFGSATAANNITVDLGSTDHRYVVNSVVNFRATAINGKDLYLSGSSWFDIAGNGQPFGSNAAGVIHMADGMRLRNSGNKNAFKTVSGTCNLFFEGDCTFSEASTKDVGGIDFSGGTVAFEKALNLYVNRWNYKFGPLASDSPCGWDVVCIEGDWAFPSTLHLGDLKMGAADKLRIRSAGIGSLPADTKGTIELQKGWITLNDATKFPNLNLVLRRGSSVTFATSSGGSQEGYLKKLVVGGGTINYKGKANTDTVYNLDLEIDGVGGTANLNPTAVSGGVTAFHAKTFARAEGAMLNVGAKTAYGDAVKFTIEGMASAAVVPWMRADTLQFAGYDENGVKQIAMEGEDFVTYEEGMTADDLAGKHVMLVGGVTYTPTADVEVRSLILNATAKSAVPKIGESDYTIKVADGIVCWQAGDGAASTIETALDFGPRRGYITFVNGRAHTISANVKGSGGLTLSDLAPTMNEVKDYKGLQLAAQMEYSGDVYVNGVVFPDNAECLPHGTDRPGIVHNEGLLNLWKYVGGLSVNGLVGMGSFGKDSGVGTITFANEGTDDVFEGFIGKYQGGTGAIGIQKNGSGKQTLNGELNLSQPISVNAGVLELNGKVYTSNSLLVKGGTLVGVGRIDAPNGFKVQDQGTLAPGSVAKPGVAMKISEGTAFTFESGSKLKVHIGADYMSQVVSAGDIKGAVTVPVVLENTYPKSCKVTLLEAKSIEPTFVLEKSAGTPGSLSIEQDEDAGLVRLCYTRTAGLMLIFR